MQRKVFHQFLVLVVDEFNSRFVQNGYGSFLAVFIIQLANHRFISPGFCFNGRGLRKNSLSQNNE